MANRVTPAEVKEILDTTMTDDQLEPFITAANSTVTTYTAGCGYTDALLKELERQLSAHMASAREQQAKSEKIGDAQVTYRGDGAGTGLASTQYGQNVMIMDTCGRLKNAGKVKAVFDVAFEAPDAGTITR